MAGAVDEGYEDEVEERKLFVLDRYHKQKKVHQTTLKTKTKHIFAATVATIQ